MGCAVRTLAAVALLLSGAAACFAADLSAIAVFNDRWAPPQCMDPVRLNASPPADVNAVWIWSSASVPVRREMARNAPLEADPHGVYVCRRRCVQPNWVH